MPLPPTRSSYDPGAVDALRAVTGVRASADDPRTALDALLAGVTDALQAGAAALVVVDERTSRQRLAARVDLPDAAAREMEAAPGVGMLGAAVTEGRDVVVEGGEDRGLLPAGMADAGLVHALAMPVRVPTRVLGAVLVAAREPLATDPLRRHAARVGVERVGWALEQSHLYETLERAMAQILETDERMLGRIGLDIHDGPTQQLSVALLEVQLLEAQLDDAEGAGATLPEPLRPALGRIYETLGGALYEMRELIGHLRPAQFDDRRLPDLIGDAVAAWESRSGAEVEARIQGEFPDDAVSLSQKITFYRILQETLTNAHRHGKATRATVSLDEGPAGITLEVQDNGEGFDLERLQRSRPGMPHARFGIPGMRDRAQLLGGVFDIRSRPGEGTRVRVFLPRWRPHEPPVPV